MRLLILTIKQNTFYFVILLTLFYFLLHLFFIKEVAEVVYDEFYYTRFAKSFLEGDWIFDVHPPLGKLIISSGLFLFGNNPIGWRITTQVFSSLLLPIIYLFTRKLTANNFAATFAALLYFFETIFFVEGHYAFFEIYVPFFLLLGGIFILNFQESGEKLDFFLGAVLFGLALSIKWSALFAISVFTIYLFLIFKKNFASWLKSFEGAATFVIIVLGAYLITFIPPILQGLDIFGWHLDALKFHQDKSIIHPYHSPWWTWYFDIRTVQFFSDTTSDGKFINVYALINPITSFVSLYALFFAFLKIIKKEFDKTALVFFLSMVSLFGWVLLPRGTFIYNVLPSLAFSIILSGVTLASIYQQSNLGRFIALGTVFLASLFFIFFFPFLVGLPVSKAFSDAHFWLQTWR